MNAEVDDLLRRLDGAAGGRSAAQVIAEEIVGARDRIAALERAVESLLAERRRREATAEILADLDRAFDAPGRAEAAPDRAEICATDMFPAEWGFHALEWSVEGVPYRWSGPAAQAEIAFHLDRRAPLAVEVGLVCAGVGVAPGELRWLADGRPLALSWRDEDGVLIGCGTLDPDPARRLTRIAVIAPRLFLDLDGDARPVGVALSHVRVAPAQVAGRAAR